MEEKFNFKELPRELQKEIMEYLPTQDIIDIICKATYKTNLSFFQTNIIEGRKILKAASTSDHDTVKSILKNNIDSFTQRGKITDSSGRTFENISGFEYALWALDKHLLTTMLQCLPRGNEGKRIKKTLLEQYEKVQTQGVTYWLNGEKFTETHFNFESTILKALRTLVGFFAPPTMNWKAAEKYWAPGLGGAQKLLPMHVVYEYCSKEPFGPTVPQFISKPQSSTQVYNYDTWKWENWFAKNSSLGVKSAIFKGEQAQPYSSEQDIVESYVEACRKDLTAMEQLYTVRQQDIIDLKLQLEGQVEMDPEVDTQPSSHFNFNCSII